MLTNTEAGEKLGEHLSAFKLKELKQAIYELLPDLKKLEFGCEVNVNNPALKNKIHIYCGNDLYNDGNYIAKLHDGDCVSMELEDAEKEKYGVEIIGKPIGLPDVLRALDLNYGINSDGFFLDLGDTINYKLKWNLKENLDNQSEEVIKFLHSLIVR